MAEVIKAGALQSPAGGTAAPRISPFNFTDMSSRADAWLDQVRAQAAKIIADANREAEQIRLRAREEGRQAALQAAEASLKKHVEAQLNRVLPALEQAGDQVLKANAAWQQEWNRRLVELANAIAGRVIRREVSRDETITLTWVREALELGMAFPSLTVQLHPDDFAVLQDRVQDLTARLSRLGPCRVVADAGVTRGGCLVTSDFGVIDQTIASQLTRIAQELQ